MFSVQWLIVNVRIVSLSLHSILNPSWELSMLRFQAIPNGGRCDFGQQFLLDEYVAISHSYDSKKESTSFPGSSLLFEERHWLGLLMCHADFAW